MCGIFGLSSDSRTGLAAERARALIDDLFLLSESRGKEAAGMALLCRSRETIEVLKTPRKASELIRMKGYDALLRAAPRDFTVIGHARLVTDGRQCRNENNQPVVKHGRAMVHNGIIANVEGLYAADREMRRDFEVDTEVLLSLYERHGEAASSADAMQAVYGKIEGAASVAMLCAERSELVLASNTGSLYLARSRDGRSLVFASERFILEQVLAKHGDLFENVPVKVGPREGYILGLGTRALTRFGLKEPPGGGPPAAEAPGAPAPRKEESARRLLRYDAAALLAVRRCLRCLLPESFPFIRFEEGVCNHCREYQPVQLKGREALEAVLARHRRRDGGYDCLVNLSGGRDSCYTLHLLKVELGMNPLAFTYDWAVLTDPARRNQSRICSRLGVEHIIVSADITRKREFIRDNIRAWLERPHLGMIPLFMAGDKQLYYHSHEVKRRNRIDLAVMGEHRFEKTRFKTSFTGIEQTRAGYMAYHVSLLSKLRLAWFYARQYLQNPAYLNGSFWDSLGAFVSYYVVPHDYLNLFEYVEWEESEVDLVLKKEYNWESAPGAFSTWRIDDGTAAFYNYLYCTLAGFTENDAFRSNQIRAGLMGRPQALERVMQENAPRYEGIRWYLDAVGLDFEETIRRVNAIPRRPG